MPDASLTSADRAFIRSQPVARLATADAGAAPHAVPICFALIGDTLFFTIDEKPKSASSRPLKRVRNILENPRAAVIVDRYDDDWSQLGWIMLRGTAEIIDAGAEHGAAQTALRQRYPQYRAMRLGELPVVAIRIDRVTRWGNLTPAA